MVFHIRRVRYTKDNSPYEPSDFSELSDDLPNKKALIEAAEDDIYAELEAFVYRMYMDEKWMFKWRVGNNFMVDTLDYIDVSGDYEKIAAIAREGVQLSDGSNPYGYHLPDVAEMFHSDDDILPILRYPKELKTKHSRY